jgi:hypothetical protein
MHDRKPMLDRHCARRATAKAASGDTVVLLPGAAGEFYTLNAGAPVHIRHDVRVMGDPAAPRPLLKVESSFTITTPSFSFEEDAAGSTLSHVAFETTGYSPVITYGRVDVSDISEGPRRLPGGARAEQLGRRRRGRRSS